ncbi:low-complexity tail membrane protein [Leptolyngbya sp. CCNP1308]|uniref:low-complexity tail membrane protein n=1 Tax=Leptolyngbya sp. CCNP1308 TaxID=3110255 RepID=UPI002B1F0465|nr:low-complexity tail membrane protein [Leptolyngbya sp. CCNP1308]MEA5451080.1 low-complexity tail membrane protein [Leptolyngbya sp. CCNP1308]
MAPWRYDPYLWVHLAGLATVPLWIDLCLLGLAVGNPTLPELELSVIVALGVLPVLVMQLLQPFYIFSLPGLAVKPTALQDDQRRLLSQFRRWRVRLGALLVPVPLVWGLLKLYPLAFLVRDLTPFGDWGRLGGLAIAVLGFSMANLFLQIPVAVLQVLATPSRTMAGISPYPVQTIAADFTWVGLPIGRILPDLVPRQSADLAAPLSAEVLEAEEPEAAIALNAKHDDMAETEPALTPNVEEVEPIDAEDSITGERAMGLPDAASEVFVDVADPEESANSATKADLGDDNAVGDYWPLRHPEADGSGDDVDYRNDADSPQSLPAIADIYPTIR